MMVWSQGTQGFPAARPCDPANKQLHQQGWSLKTLSPTTAALAAPGGGCLAQQGGGFPGGAGGLTITACNATDPAQVFSYDASTKQLKQVSSGHCVDVHSGGPIVWMYGCTSSPNDQLQFVDGTVRVAVGTAGLCFGVEQDDPAGATAQSTLQAWAKPLSEQAGVALLLINPTTSSRSIEVPLAALPLTGSGTNLTKALSVGVRDIWARADAAPLAKGAATVKLTVPAMDSSFVRLHAAAATTAQL